MANKKNIYIKLIQSGLRKISRYTTLDVKTSKKIKRYLLRKLTNNIIERRKF